MRLIIALSLICVLCGCGLEILGTTAIRNKMEKDAAKSASSAMTGVKDMTSRLEAEQAITTWRAERGQNPPSLEALVREGYLNDVPATPEGKMYGYDPATGSLLEPSARRAAGLQQVQQAVMAYARQHGRYPPSLDALSPRYLPAPPATADGRPYRYNPATGRVLAPGPGSGTRPSPAPRRARPSGPSGIGEQHNRNQERIMDDLGI
jgi:competence protein ComGC